MNTIVRTVGLAHCASNDGKAVRGRKRAKCNEYNDQQIVGIDNVLSTGEHDGVGLTLAPTSSRMAKEMQARQYQ